MQPLLLENDCMTVGQGTHYAVRACTLAIALITQGGDNTILSQYSN